MALDAGFVGLMLAILLLVLVVDILGVWAFIYRGVVWFWESMEWLEKGDLPGAD